MESSVDCKELWLETLKKMDVVDTEEVNRPSKGKGNEKARMCGNWNKKLF